MWVTKEREYLDIVICIPSAPQLFVAVLAAILFTAAASDAMFDSLEFLSPTHIAPIEIRPASCAPMWKGAVSVWIVRSR